MAPFGHHNAAGCNGAPILCSHAPTPEPFMHVFSHQCLIFTTAVAVNTKLHGTSHDMPTGSFWPQPPQRLCWASSQLHAGRSSNSANKVAEGELIWLRQDICMYCTNQVHIILLYICRWLWLCSNRGTDTVFESKFHPQKNKKLKILIPGHSRLNESMVAELSSYHL